MSQLYQVTIPSRKRPERIKRMLELFPEALVYVAESEEQTYRAELPAKRLRTHPDLDGIAAIRNWMLDHTKAKVQVQCDDDFEEVLCMVGRRPRHLREPSAIRQLVANGAQMLLDSQLTLYSWASSARLLYFRGCDPFNLSTVGSCILCIRDTGIRFDARFKTDPEDLDFGMQCLARDRIALCDRRFYWNFGGFQQTRGGLQGVRTSELVREGEELLRAKWGDYVKFREKSGGRRGYSIKVPRRNALAITK